MRAYKKYTAAALCLLVLLLPLLLLMGLQLQQWQLKRQALERMEQSMLHTLHIASADLVWEKQGRELRLGQRLFDVHSIKATPGGFKVTGIYDNEETAIENLLAQQSGQDNSLVHLLLMMQLLFLSIAFCIYPFAAFSKNSAFPSFSSLLSPGVAFIAWQPPKKGLAFL